MQLQIMDLQKSLLACSRMYEYVKCMNTNTYIYVMQSACSNLCYINDDVDCVIAIVANCGNPRVREEYKILR